MAKSPKKKSYLATKNLSQTDEKEKSSKLFIISCWLIVIFSMFMFNNVMDQYMISYALKSALSYEYVYSNYIENKLSPLDTVFSTVFYCIMFSYSLIILIFFDFSGYGNHSNHSSGGSGGGRWSNIIGNIIAGWLIFPILSIIPIIFFCIIHHHNVDRFMYKNIKNLYNIVSQDQKFLQTSINTRFQKAIQEKDYDTLKELSNNINALAKVTPEQLRVLEDAVNKLPISKIKSDFDTFKEGYTSYAEYKVFYDKSKKLFNNSEYKSDLNYIEEMKKLKIIGFYDYESIKTII